MQYCCFIDDLCKVGCLTLIGLVLVCNGLFMSTLHRSLEIIHDGGTDIVEIYLRSWFSDFA